MTWLPTLRMCSRAQCGCADEEGSTKGHPSPPAKVGVCSQAAAQMDEEDAASTPTASSSGGPEATGATRHRAMPKPSYFAKPVIHAPLVPSATPADASVEAGDQVRSVSFPSRGTMQDCYDDACKKEPYGSAMEGASISGTCRRTARCTCGMIHGPLMPWHGTGACCECFVVFSC